MVKYLLAFSLSCVSLFAHDAKVIAHNDLPTFTMNNNSLQGVSTKDLGANEIEVWRSSISVGSCTPAHTHDVEEVFIIFEGKMKVMLGEEAVVCEAPCTLICPPYVKHQLFNVGEVPTDHLVILQIDSNIYNHDMEPMHLPWR